MSIDMHHENSFLSYCHALLHKGCAAFCRAMAVKLATLNNEEACSILLSDCPASFYDVKSEVLTAVRRLESSDGTASKRQS